MRNEIFLVTLTIGIVILAISGIFFHFIFSQETKKQCLKEYQEEIDCVNLCKNKICMGE